MQLSRQLLKQFANITNNRSNTNNEATVYGEVIEVDDSIGSNGLLSGLVRIDGSTVTTPVTSTVKMEVGHRVIIRLKNHSATVTSNLNDPSASSKEHGLLVENCITFGNYDETIYSLFSPTMEGDDWSRDMRPTDMYRKDTKDAGETWNGPYQFRAVDGENGENGENGHNIMFQYGASVNGPWYYTQIATRKFRRESTDGGVTWGQGYQYVFDKDDVAGLLPSYIGETEITKTTIRSPEIYGGLFYGNDFQVIAETPGEGGLSLHGFFGGRLYQFFRVWYWADLSPMVSISSPDNGELFFRDWSRITFGNYNPVSDSNPAFPIDFAKTTKVSFDGEVDLSGATNINFGDNVPTVYAVFK